ncbi:hypothetical protein LZ31DRAFT_63839 [Colletotrichum somersetense]|nr:hypothetical protein LZ31DRAFT_63839 [Colletotrichum somersetense]
MSVHRRASLGHSFCFLLCFHFHLNHFPAPVPRHSYSPAVSSVRLHNPATRSPSLNPFSGTQAYPLVSFQRLVSSFLPFFLSLWRSFPFHLHSTMPKSPQKELQSRQSAWITRALALSSNVAHKYPYTGWEPHLT